MTPINYLPSRATAVSVRSVLRPWFRRRRPRLTSLLGALVAVVAFATVPSLSARAPAVFYRTVQVNGLSIFYREAGPVDAPVVLLLHGFPTSSHQFRDLIPLLATRYRVIAPDYPGFGQSAAPATENFAYTFDHLADVIEGFTRELRLARYNLYVHDYGAPVGFRLALRHPEKVETITTQNGNAYDEGLTEFWTPFRNGYWKQPTPENAEALRGAFKLDATRAIPLAGARDQEKISPDFWTVSQAGLDRPGNHAVQLALFLDYRTNPPLYARWQQYFRQHQPPMLVVWGKNDPIFGPAGATAFLRDLKQAELHLLDTGHFALEEDSELIGEIMLRFLDRNAHRPGKSAHRAGERLPAR
jgi:pimeloyl-ACP methyl ester carboxylesterase